jgi:hypothetical protein
MIDGVELLRRLGQQQGLVRSKNLDTTLDIVRYFQQLDKNVPLFRISH